MLVRGQKQLTLNRGDEYIQISGLVRPADITPDNRVASTRVADAKITYSGKGELARASQQGRSEEHTSELQSLMRISYAVFCLKKKKKTKYNREKNTKTTKKKTQTKT